MKKVISKDGTSIAFERTGSGPAFILIDGAFCSKSFGPMVKLAPVLARHFTVITYDRRARGESGDTKPYSAQREIEDIDALIEEAGGTASLYGVSSGAILALHAAASGLNITKLALLEPPFVGNNDGRRPADAAEQLTRMIAGGRKDEACKFYLQKMIGVPPIVTFFMAFTKNWKKMKANANSLPYDAAICGDFSLPKGLLRSVSQPSLVLASTKSPKALRAPVKEVAERLPRGRQLELNGGMHDIPPEILVPALVDFHQAR